MTVVAVEGPAGCGKTFRLMEVLTESLRQSPLQEGQKVLALTFMHGARRRLDERLRGIAVIRRRFECATIDSFAWRLLHRWRSLALRLGLQLGPDFDAQCDAAGALLERQDVRAWVSASFPIVLIDEAQDLKPQRLRMVRALADSVTLLVAADEFQCLDTTLRPNPLVEWLRAACQPQVLNQNRRTNVTALIAGATSIRAGAALTASQNLRILSAQGVPMAAANLANAIAWRRGGNVAVITPSLQGGFARSVVDRVCGQSCGSQQNGPYPIKWDSSDDAEAASLVQQLHLAAVSTTAETLAAFERLPRTGLAREARAWVDHQSRAAGRTEFSAAEIEAVVARQVSVRRQRYGADNHELLAMTVQQAKNREFDGVCVLWPYQVGGDAEHKRRLLYNALTRAKRWCTIVAQNATLLQQPPFS